MKISAEQAEEIGQFVQAAKDKGLTPAEIILDFDGSGQYKNRKLTISATFAPMTLKGGELTTYNRDAKPEGDTEAAPPSGEATPPSGDAPTPPEPPSPPVPPESPGTNV